MSIFDPRLTDFFGEGVLAAGFLPVPHLFLRHYRVLGLTPAHAMFVLELLAGTWDLGEPPRTVGDLARRMGVDRRTIRKYSEDIAGLGLITLQDRFDATGAQIENDYDLTELFARLAAFAPQLPSADIIPNERAGDSPSMTHGTEEDTYHVRQRENDAFDSTEGPLILPGEESAIQEGPDQIVRPPRIGRSALKQESLKNRFLMMMPNDEGDKSGEESPRDGERPVINSEAAQVGWSIRWQQPLSLGDIQASAEVLRRMHIDRPLRDVIAASMAPAEAWALWAFAEARSWRSGLIIREVYDITTRRCRTAGNLEPVHDTVGGLLVPLAPEDAERLLHQVSQHCPHAPAALLAYIKTQDRQASQAAKQLWTMMARLRGHSESALPLSPITIATPSMTTANNTFEIWQTARELLQARLPPESYATWIEPATLLHLEEGRAVIGVPHVFARDTLVSEYLPTLAEVLEIVMGSPLAISIAIEPPSHTSHVTLGQISDDRRTRLQRKENTRTTTRS